MPRLNDDGMNYWRSVPWISAAIGSTVALVVYLIGTNEPLREVWEWQGVLLEFLMALCLGESIAFGTFSGAKWLSGHAKQFGVVIVVLAPALCGAAAGALLGLGIAVFGGDLSQSEERSISRLLVCSGAVGGAVAGILHLGVERFRH